MVGRDVELAQLDEFVASDVPSLEILGEIGAGKSALTSELARRLLHRGEDVISAGPDPTSSDDDSAFDARGLRVFSTDVARPFRALTTAVADVLGVAIVISVDPADGRAPNALAGSL